MSLLISLKAQLADERKWVALLQKTIDGMEFVKIVKETLRDGKYVVVPTDQVRLIKSTPIKEEFSFAVELKSGCLPEEDWDVTDTEWEIKKPTLIIGDRKVDHVFLTSNIKTFLQNQIIKQILDGLSVLRKPEQFGTKQKSNRKLLFMNQSFLLKNGL